LLGRAAFTAAAREVFISANVRHFFHRDTSATARLIFNGIDTAHFRPASAIERRTAREQLRFPGRRKIVLFVGRFVRKKGFHIIKPLAQRFPEFLWVFVGSGPEDPSGWAYPNVRVVGRIEHPEIPTYYQAADLLILPSSGEGFPLVVQEALACGLGVLSTEEVGEACPDAREMIRACPTPRHDTDTETWAHALQTTIADDAYLGARDVRSRQARALWSWDRCASEYVRLFEEIAGNAH
jgi:glycosyltransferase involved in cell wall biosynthesis